MFVSNCTDSPKSWQNVSIHRTPQPLRRQLPFQGRLGLGLYEFALDFLNGILRTAADPSAALCAAAQLCIKRLYAVEDGYTR